MLSVVKRLFTKKRDTAIIDAILEDAILIDVRSQLEYEHDSVDTAINIPLNTLSKQWNALNKHKPIVVFCHSGTRSGQAKHLLDSHGFTKVIDGGSWKQVKEVIREVYA
jgi:phage shock protein E